MSKISDKKLWLVIILVILSLAINFRPVALRLYKNIEAARVAAAHPYQAGQCLVQYEPCAFTKEKEAWQEGCTNPYKNFYKINQVGQRKYLVTEIFKDGKTQMKELDKLDVHRSRDTDSAEHNYYDIDCTDVEVNWELDSKDIVTEPQEINYDALVNKCVITENDCSPENLESWELESYCHPFDLSYKVLEVGKNKIHLKTWYGHANDKFSRLPMPIGIDRTITKSEYDLLDFKEEDCSGLEKRFPKNFDTLKGRRVSPRKN